MRALTWGLRCGMRCGMFLLVGSGLWGRGSRAGAQGPSTAAAAASLTVSGSTALVRAGATRSNL